MLCLWQAIGGMDISYLKSGSREIRMDDFSPPERASLVLGLLSLLQTLLGEILLKHQAFSCTSSLWSRFLGLAEVLFAPINGLKEAVSCV